MLTLGALIHNRYEIIRQIGKGGMGAVYEATDTRLNSTVALKQTIIDGEQVNKAFKREAQLLAQLRHPNLPRVMDYFVLENEHFLVMEFSPVKTSSNCSKNVKSLSL